GAAIRVDVCSFSLSYDFLFFFFFFQAEDGIRDATVTGVQTCALPISHFDGRFEAARYLDELRRRPGVHPQRVDDLGLPLDHRHSHPTSAATASRARP